MASLKSLRQRIASVKATRKITSAMKMVAASKLRRAQDQAVAARPFAERMERMLLSLAGASRAGSGALSLLAGTGKDDTHLIVVATADRGLCGGFNGAIVREARRVIGDLLRSGKTVKVLCVGRKGRDQIRRDFARNIVASMDSASGKVVRFSDAEAIAARINAMLAAGEFDVCTIIYSRFRSVISQIPTRQQLIPLPPPPKAAAGEAAGPKAVYEFEPDGEELLVELLPRNLAVQIYRALLENAAGEQGARMSAMDNATRNAGDMINRLTLNYNRTRQAQITKELIEIVSGAEAL